MRYFGGKKNKITSLAFVILLTVSARGHGCAIDHYLGHPDCRGMLDFSERFACSLEKLFVRRRGSDLIHFDSAERVLMGCISTSQFEEKLPILRACVDKANEQSNPLKELSICILEPGFF